ncbi:MAG: dihydroorotate dehydrogenase electron transfer subunit [Syntrophomonadaceae bacterium]|nr:dihydroorotate dehydrogenase electron transfer subunit [Syntrophomonadaceae bacterium]
MSSVEKALVIRHREVVPDYYELEFIAPEIALEVLPGQFVNIRISDSLDPLLRRPFSVYDVDKKLGSITVFYKVVGKGTKLLSQMPIQKPLDVMGPLGRSFSIPTEADQVFLVGGGVGIAPLVYLSRVLSSEGIKTKVLMGASTAGFLAGKSMFEKFGVPFLVSTDDGSEGLKGRVTQLLAEQLLIDKCDYIFACGPESMLETVTELAMEQNIKGEISLEGHMACGVGACLGCAHLVKTGEGQRYAKICSEGPVFKIGEVLFHSQDER